MILNEIREGLKEFLKELEHNRNINKQIGAENVINIDYVIERIKDILKY